MGIKWTEEETSLIQTCNKKSIDEIKKLLPNRSEIAIRTKCSDYNIKILSKDEWTDEELEILKTSNAKTMSELLELLPKRNILGIRGMAFRLKINIRAERLWTQEEIDIVNKANNKLTLSQTLELLPNRTKQALKDYAQITNIKFKRPTIWSEDDVELLKSVCNRKTSLKEIYSMFPNIAERVINNKIHKLGLRHLVTISFKEWSIEEDNFIINNFFSVKSKDIAKILNVSENMLSDRARVLGLERKVNLNPLSQEEIVLLESIKSDCLSLNEICSLFPHRTIPSLRHILKKMNIQYNKKDYYSSDGITKLKSIEERDIFDFIRTYFNVNITLSNGKKFKNKLLNEGYVPDYIINKINDIILYKELIIEYYGLYNLINPSSFIQDYIEKTHRKNEYYKNNSDIYFIDLYPTDLQNNFQGVRNKLVSFFLENFNINILDSKEVY